MYALCVDLREQIENLILQAEQCVDLATDPDAPADPGLLAQACKTVSQNAWELVGQVQDCISRIDNPTGDPPLGLSRVCNTLGQAVDLVIQEVGQCVAEVQNGPRSDQVIPTDPSSACRYAYGKKQDVEALAASVVQNATQCVGFLQNPPSSPPPINPNQPSSACAYASGTLYNGDGDASPTQNEVLCGSQPADAASTCATDDDGDGTTNTLEAAVPNVAAPFQASCTGSYGLVLVSDCGGYADPPFVPTSNCGLPFQVVCVDSTASKGVWVWDSICLPGALGAYASCTGASSNYGAGDALYGGTFVGDGYGWRHVANLNSTYVDVWVTEVCPGYPVDADGDDVYYIVTCSHQYRVYTGGTIQDMGRTTNPGSLGDPDDADPNNPVVSIITVALPCGAAAGADADLDGVPSNVTLQYCYYTLDRRTGGLTITRDPADDETIPIDPDDSDPTNPSPRLDYTCTTVTREGGDGVSYNLGAHFTVAGQGVGDCQSNTVDLGLLPQSVTVPSGELPTIGPDADGDHVPAYVSVPMTTKTINDDAALSITDSPAPPQVLPIDPDDADSSTPVPRLDETCTTVDRPTGDTVHYRLGVKVSWFDSVVVDCDERTVGGGLLPLTVRVPSGLPTIGPDADGDKVPAYVDVPMQNVTINNDPGLSTTQTPAGTERTTPDPNDSDPTNPVPRLDEVCAQVDRPDADSVHFRIGVRYTYLGTAVNNCVEQTKDGGVLPYSFAAPAGAPIPGPDADGDGLPAYVDVPMQIVTIGSNTPLPGVTTTPTTTVRQGIDPDDGDASDPIPCQDCDGDHIPDLLENEFCGREFFRNTVNGDPEGDFGRCPGPPWDDYVPPDANVTADIPVGVLPGPDSDQDGVPATITILRQHVEVHPFRLNPLTVGPAAPVVLDVDPDDADPNDPASSVVTTDPLPVGADRGPDADNDGVPAYVAIHRVVLTLDRRNPTNPVTITAVPDFVQGVDPDDAEDSNPLPHVDETCTLVERPDGDSVHYRLGLAIRFMGEDVASCEEDTVDLEVLPLTVRVPSGRPTAGPDADGDGLPAYVDVPTKNVTINDDAALSRSEAPAPPVRQDVDPDDEDANNPVPRVVTQETCTTVERSTGDGVHYRLGLRFTVAGSPQGFCEEDTVDADVLPKTVTVPSGIPTIGPDADGDKVPAYVDVPMKNVTINDDAALSITETAAPTVRQNVDPNDANPNNPYPQVVVVEQCTTVERVTGDGVHYRLGIRFTVGGSPMGACVEDTKDADVLPVSVTVPSGTPTLGPDADGDGVPAWVEVPRQTITINDDAGLTRTFTAATPIHQDLDPDDSDPDDPVPRQDLDGDNVPDVLEEPICVFVNNSNRPEDGKCVEEDGSGADGSGHNYVPPPLP